MQDLGLSVGCHSSTIHEAPDYGCDLEEEKARDKNFPPKERAR